jgi:hypothetical protein
LSLAATAIPLRKFCVKFLDTAKSLNVRYCPQKRKLELSLEMSALCQKETLAGLLQRGLTAVAGCAAMMEL